MLNPIHKPQVQIISSPNTSPSPSLLPNISQNQNKSHTGNLFVPSTSSHLFVSSPHTNTPALASILFPQPIATLAILTLLAPNSNQRAEITLRTIQWMRFAPKKHKTVAKCFSLTKQAQKCEDPIVSF